MPLPTTARLLMSKNTTIPPHSVEVKIKGEKNGFPV
jgi:hypothetical protein